MRIIRTTVLAIALAATCACKPIPPLKEYAYPAWGFAVSFRGAPKQTDSPASPDGAARHTLLVESAMFGRDELVNVVDGSGSSKSDEQALSDAPASLAAAAGATLGPITYAATGKIMGREFLLNREGRPSARARIFVANKHLYEIVAQSPLGPDDREVSSFLDSFRLLGS
jgi:hypothetical protein